MVTLHIRKFAGYVMLVPAGTLFLAYLFRPRPYVLAGAFAWTAGSVMLLALSFDSGAAGSASPETITVGRLGVGVWAVFSLIFGSALRYASGWFRAPSTISRPVRLTLVIVIAWIVLGAAMFRRPGAILAPAFVLMTAWHVMSAVGYLRVFRQYRFVGAAVSGAGVFGVAVVNTVAISVAIAAGGIGQASTSVAYFNFLASALLVLGMHLLIFEDVIEELRKVEEELKRKDVRVWLRPELTGKPLQHGTVEELIKLANGVETVLPCIDWSHLHARNGGGWNSYEEWCEVLDKLATGIKNKNVLQRMHMHVSGIEYGPKGEKRHIPLATADLRYKELMAALKQAGVCGTLVVEAPRESLDVDIELFKEAWDAA